MLCPARLQDHTGLRQTPSAVCPRKPSFRPSVLQVQAHHEARRKCSRNNVLTLVFRIRKGEKTLDLRSTFPEYIYSFKPRYNFKISWGDEEDSSSEGVFSNGIKNLIHTYNVELEDDRSSHVDFTVKIRGVCEGLGQIPHNCIRCEESSGIKYFGKCFSYCSEFYEFPDTFFHSIGELRPSRSQHRIQRY